MATNLRLFIITLAASVSFSTQAAKPKPLLSIYESRPLTFLCETPFNPKGKAQIAACASCAPQETAVQWMPIVSAHYYLHDKSCYTEKLCIDKNGSRFGGIRCCRQHDARFQQFEKDMHNLVPEVPELKKLAHKYHFGNANQTGAQQSACYLMIDKKNKILEPDDKLKGMIGRTFLYMQIKYKLALPASEKNLFDNWHRYHPVTAWERKRNQLIKDIQGDGDPYV